MEGGGGTSTLPFGTPNTSNTSNVGSVTKGIAVLHKSDTLFENLFAR